MSLLLAFAVDIALARALLAKALTLSATAGVSPGETGPCRCQHSRLPRWSYCGFSAAKCCWSRVYTANFSVPGSPRQASHAMKSHRRLTSPPMSARMHKGYASDPILGIILVGLGPNAGPKIPDFSSAVCRPLPTFSLFHQ